MMLQVDDTLRAGWCFGGLCMIPEFALLMDKRETKNIPTQKKKLCCDLRLSPCDDDAGWISSNPRVIAADFRLGVEKARLIQGYIKACPLP